MAVSDAHEASRRRVVYGANAVLQVILAIGVLVGVVWFAGEHRWQADMTRTGVNSLSTRTKQLLNKLDQNIRITAVFAEPDKRDEIGQKRRRAIGDLLELYDSAGGARVSAYLIDPSLQQDETAKLLQRLTELPVYRDEAQPHRDALARFTPLNEKISALAGAEYQRAEELATGAPEMARNRSFSIVRNNLQLAVREAASIPETIQELSTGEVPRYGGAVKEVRDYLNTVELTMRDASTWMGGDALAIPDLTPELTAFFEGAPSRYESVLAEITELLDLTKDLKDVKLEELYAGLSGWRSGPPVLIESETEARIMPFWEVWKQPEDRNVPVSPGGDTREFAGEAAISSAILQLTQREKTAVIFTYYGGESPIKPDFSQVNRMMRQMPTAPYQKLARLLERANFVTEDWDVQQAKTPPEIEDAVRRVYVVYPPEPPPRPNPMQPPTQAGMTPGDRQIILDAIEESGMGVFLAGWTPPQSPMPGASETYEFGDYLESNWGVVVQNNYLTLEFAPDPSKPGWWAPASREPRIITTDSVVRFTEHPIGRPLQADRGGFLMVAPLEIAEDEDFPSGVTVEPIAEVAPTDDVWACNDLRRLDEQWKRDQGFRPDDADLTAPFAIAMAATNEQGRKVVVFSSEQFAADRFAQESGLRRAGNQLVLGALYPANTDLLINTLHWLTGEADRIAIGPRRGELPTLNELNADWAGRLPWFLVLIWPALGLVAGVGVWLVRRR